MFSGIVNYKKEIYNDAEYNRRNHVILQCHRHGAREGRTRIASILKGPLSVHTRKYVTS